MRWQDWIERNPKVMLGKPVFKGTRLTVELILERLGAGATEAGLLESYPTLKREHIQAAFAYAAASMRTDELLDIPPQASAAAS